jgi:hypothetical protein
MSTDSTKTSTTVNASINNLSLPNDQKKKASESLLTKIIIFIIESAPIVSGIGAIFYGISSFMNIDFPSGVTNNNIRIIINVYIFICGLITVFEGWFINLFISGTVSLYYNS